MGFYWGYNGVMWGVLLGIYWGYMGGFYWGYILGLYGDNGKRARKVLLGFYRVLMKPIGDNTKHIPKANPATVMEKEQIPILRALVEPLQTLHDHLGVSRNTLWGPGINIVCIY